MDELISIYRLVDGVQTTVCSISKENASLNQGIMDKDKVTLSVVTEDPIYLTEGDYILLEGVKYKINRDPEDKQKSEKEHSYEISLEAPIYTLIDKVYCNKITGSTTFSLTGKLRDFIELLIWNINVDNNPLGVDTGWTIGLCPDTDYLNITFDSVKCRDVLDTLASKFGLEYYATNKTINYVSRIENETGLVFTQGRGGGLYEVERKNVDDGDLVTRVYPKGGTENVIPGEGDFEGRLMLPEGYIENFSESKRGVEAVVIFDGIHPTFQGSVGTVSGETNREFLCPGIDFNIADVAVGDEGRINFLTGDLMGKSFEFKWDNNLKKITLIYQEDNLAEIDPNTGSRPNIPSASKYLRGGELFNFTGLKLSGTYKTNAITKLRQKATEWLAYYCRKRIKFELTVDYRYIRQNNVELHCGDLITINVPLHNISKLIRITSIEKNLHTGKLTCTVSNYLDEKWRDKIEEQIGEIKSSTATVNGGYGATSVTILEKNDEREPSDSNVMSALRTLKEISQRAISRTNPDEAAELITFLKGLISEDTSYISQLIVGGTSDVSSGLTEISSEEDTDVVVTSLQETASEEEVDGSTLGGLTNVNNEVDVQDAYDMILMRTAGAEKWGKKKLIDFLADNLYPFSEITADFNNNFTVDFSKSQKSLITLSSSLSTLSILNASTTKFGYIIIIQKGFKKIVRISDNIIGDIIIPEGSGSMALLSYIKINDNVCVSCSSIKDTSTAIIPTTISDFLCVFYNNRILQFRWTAPYCVNTYESVDFYEIRYTNTPDVDVDNDVIWTSLSKITVDIIPKKPGQQEDYTFVGLSANTSYFFYIKSAKIINGAYYYSSASEFVHIVTTGTTVEDQENYTLYKIPITKRNLVTRLKSTIVNAYDNELCEIEKVADEENIDHYDPSTGYIDTSFKEYKTYWSIYKYGRDCTRYSTIIDLFSTFTLDKFFIFPKTNGSVSIYAASSLGQPFSIVDTVTASSNTWITVDFAGSSFRFIKLQYDLQSFTTGGIEPTPSYNGTIFDIASIALYGRNVDVTKLNIMPAKKRSTTKKTVDEFFCVNGHFYQPGRIFSTCSGSRVRLFGAGGHFMDPLKISTYTRVADLRFRFSNIPWTIGNGTGENLRQLLEKTYKRYRLKPFITFSSGLDICRYTQGSDLCRPVDDYWLPDKWRPVYKTGVKGDVDLFNITTNPSSYKTYAKLAAGLAAKYGSTEMANFADTYVDLSVETDSESGLDLLSGVECGNEQDKSWSGISGYTTPEELASLMSAWYDGNNNMMTDEEGNALGSYNSDRGFNSIFPGTAGANLGYFFNSYIHWAISRKDYKIPVSCLNFHTYCSNIGDQGNSSLAVQYAITYEAFLKGATGKVIKDIVEFRDRFIPDTELWVTEFGFGESGAVDSASKYQCYSQAGRIIDGWVIPDRHRGDVKGSWTVRATLAMMAAGIDLCNYYSAECESNWFDTGQYGAGAGLEMFKWQKLTDSTPGAKVNAIKPYEVAYNRGGFSALGLFGSFLSNGGYPISRAYWYVACMRNTLKDYIFIGMKTSTISSEILIYCFRKKGEAKGAYAIYLNSSINTGIKNVPIEVPDGVTSVDRTEVYVPNIPDPSVIPADYGVDQERTGLPTSRREIYKEGQWVVENTLLYNNVTGSITNQPSVYPEHAVEGDVCVTLPSIDENPYYPIVGPVCAVRSKLIPSSTPEAKGYIKIGSYDSNGDPVYEYKINSRLAWRQVDAICDFIEYSEEGKKGFSGITTELEVNNGTFSINVSEFPSFFTFDGIPITDYDSQVTDLVGKPLNVGSVALYWNNNSNEDTGFRIYISKNIDSDYSLHSEIVNNGQNTCIIDGLLPSTTYYFKVSPCRDLTEGTLSTPCSVLTYDVVKKIIGFRANDAAKTLTSIALLWDIPTSGDDTFISYQIFRGSEMTDFVKVKSIYSMSENLYIDEGLAADTVYSYKIRAIGSNGVSEFSDIVEASTSSITETKPHLMSASINLSMTIITLNFDVDILNETLDASIFSIYEGAVLKPVYNAEVSPTTPTAVLVTIEQGVLADAYLEKEITISYQASATSSIKSLYNIDAYQFNSVPVTLGSQLSRFLVNIGPDGSSPNAVKANIDTVTGFTVSGISSYTRASDSAKFLYDRNGVLSTSISINYNLNFYAVNSIFTAASTNVGGQASQFVTSDRNFSAATLKYPRYSNPSTVKARFSFNLPVGRYVVRFMWAVQPGSLTFSDVERQKCFYAAYQGLEILDSVVCSQDSNFSPATNSEFNAVLQFSIDDASIPIDISWYNTSSLTYKPGVNIIEIIKLY